MISVTRLETSINKIEYFKYPECSQFFSLVTIVQKAT